MFVIDPVTGECVHYEPMETFPRKKRVDINSEIFERHAEIECRNDLIDPLIDICSVEVCWTTIIEFAYGIYTYIGLAGSSTLH